MRAFYLRTGAVKDPVATRLVFPRLPSERRSGPVESHRKNPEVALYIDCEKSHEPNMAITNLTPSPSAAFAPGVLWNGRIMIGRCIWIFHDLLVNRSPGALCCLSKSPNPGGSRYLLRMDGPQAESTSKPWCLGLTTSCIKFRVEDYLRYSPFWELRIRAVYLSR